MKRSLILIAAVALLAGACSQYTCPTYAKAEKETKTIKAEKAQNF